MSQNIDRRPATRNADTVLASARPALLRHVRIESHGRLDASQLDDIVSDAITATLAKSPAPDNPLAYAKRVATNEMRDHLAEVKPATAEPPEDRAVGSAEDAAVVYETAVDRREPILAECRRRFRKVTSVAWTFEIATTLLTQCEPKPSIEGQARSLFEELRAVIGKVDSFVAAHVREASAEMDARLERWCSETDARDAELTRERDAEYDDEVTDEEHAERLERREVLALLREERRRSPPIPASHPAAAPPIKPAREWGPATDFLRMLMLGLSPLPEPLVGDANPWPPLVSDEHERARERAIESVLAGHTPWWTPTSTRLSRPEDIALVTILLGLCDWPSLLEKPSAAEAIRHEAKKIRGALKRRDGKLVTVIQVDTKKGSSKVVQVRRDTGVRAKNDAKRVQSAGPETVKGACTTQHAPRRRPLRSKLRPQRPRRSP